MPDPLADSLHGTVLVVGHPERISEQLVTMRTVQTLSLIDMLNYREHIYRLGDYASSGDDAGQALALA